MNDVGFISTERFLLRPLCEQDATERYLSWLQDDSCTRFIGSAALTTGLSDLKAYIRQFVGRDDALFLGIFEKESCLHIGNIKYEPINYALSSAVVGVLIGDRGYRGCGATPEVLRASAKWLAQHRGIKEITLGVSKDNSPAIAAYLKVGFVIQNVPGSIHQAEKVRMNWKL